MLCRLSINQQTKSWPRRGDWLIGEEISNSLLIPEYRPVSRVFTGCSFGAKYGFDGVFQKQIASIEFRVCAALKKPGK
jgi:hypothetical protein